MTNDELKQQLFNHLNAMIKVAQEYKELYANDQYCLTAQFYKGYESATERCLEKLTTYFELAKTVPVKLNAELVLDTNGNVVSLGLK